MPIACIFLSLFFGKHWKLMFAPESQVLSLEFRRHGTAVREQREAEAGPRKSTKQGQSAPAISASEPSNRQAWCDCAVGHHLLRISFRPCVLGGGEVLGSWRWEAGLWGATWDQFRHQSYTGALRLAGVFQKLWPRSHRECSVVWEARELRPLTYKQGETESPLLSMAFPSLISCDLLNSRSSRGLSLKYLRATFSMNLFM